MSDTGVSRSQHKGSRRQAHRRVGSIKPLHNFEAAATHQGFDSVRHADRFGRGFEPQNGSYHPESGPVQDVKINNNATHSESSESERISALHGNLHSRTLPNDTHGLQQYMADLEGEIGRLTKVQDVVSAILHDRSEAQRLSAELKEEKEKADAADQLCKDRLARAESDCKAEAVKSRQLQQQVTALQEQERQLQHALYEAQRHVQSRESVLAQWKEDQGAAEAEAVRKLAAAEASTHTAQEELRSARAEISALNRKAAERQSEEDKRKAEMVEIIDQWRGLVKDKDEEVWHFQNEIRQMDKHYRRELDALVAAKTAVDAELHELREGGDAIGSMQPALSIFPPPPALPAAQAEGRATPTPSTARSAPQKGIRNGGLVDATQRSVAPELRLIMNGGSLHGAPENAPELLSEQQLVDLLLDIVPRGEAHAKKFSQSDYQKLEASLGGRRWDQSYHAKYGSVADFMRTHPEAFYQSANGAFYRPDAPARRDAAPQQLNSAPTTAAASTALIISPGAAKPAVAPKRPAVISTVVTPAAPAHMRAKRASNTGGSSASADAKQQQPQQQPQQVLQQQHEQPARTLAVPVNVAPGSGRPPKPSEKTSAAAAASSQPDNAQRAEARKPEQTNGSAGPPKQQQGYLYAAKKSQVAAPRQLIGEFPELNGGSKERRKEAPAKEQKPGPNMPPGLPRPTSTAERQNSFKEPNGGSDRSAPVNGVGVGRDGDEDSSRGEAAGDGKGSAQLPASQQNAGGADKEKSRKKWNAKKVKGGDGVGIVGAP